MLLLGHVSKIVSILLSKLSNCPNTDTLLCYYNYLFLTVQAHALPYSPFVLLPTPFPGTAMGCVNVVCMHVCIDWKQKDPFAIVQGSYSVNQTAKANYVRVRTYKLPKV